MFNMKSNYTMGKAMEYCKKNKNMSIFMGIILFIFPFFPPYYFGFDPRVESQVPIFYAYLTVYYVVYVIFLGQCGNKARKVKKVINEKLILMGCPLEIKEMGAKGSNSYSTTILVNEEMLALVKEHHVDDYVHMAKEEVALKEPFVKKFPIGSGSSAKFIGKNVPHFDKARKIGVLPEGIEHLSVESEDVENMEESDSVEPKEVSENVDTVATEEVSTGENGVETVESSEEN